MMLLFSEDFSVGLESPARGDKEERAKGKGERRESKPDNLKTFEDHTCA